jgi:protein-S-isoprenylcysteine O-methyltransferase Ste14
MNGVIEPTVRYRRRSLWRWLNSTSRRTFVVIPPLVVLAEWGLGALGMGQAHMVFVPWGVPFMVWGYLQYRLGGRYRTRLGGGGPGLDVPPDRIVDSGVYGYIRNPMYLGHIIFLAGLAIALQSWIALGLLTLHMVWFEYRVREDESHLSARFGAAYDAYKARTRRWIPFVY